MSLEQNYAKACDIAARFWRATVQVVRPVRSAECVALLRAALPLLRSSAAAASRVGVVDALASHDEHAARRMAARVSS